MRLTKEDIRAIYTLTEDNLLEGYHGGSVESEKLCKRISLCVFIEIIEKHGIKIENNIKFSEFIREEAYERLRGEL